MFKKILIIGLLLQIGLWGKTWITETSLDKSKIQENDMYCHGVDKKEKKKYKKTNKCRSDDSFNDNPFLSEFSVRKYNCKKNKKVMYYVYGSSKERCLKNTKKTLAYLNSDEYAKILDNPDLIQKRKEEIKAKKKQEQEKQLVKSKKETPSKVITVKKVKIENADKKLVLEKKKIDIKKVTGKELFNYLRKKGKKDISLAQQMIDNGADVNYVDKNNQSNLHYAMWNKDLEVAKLLIKNGINVNIKTKKGFSAIYIPDDVKLVKYLLEHGADVNLKMIAGWTTLHSAASSSNMELVKLLLKHGASKSIKNNDDKMPFELATNFKVLEILSPHTDNYISIRPNAYICNNPKDAVNSNLNKRNCFKAETDTVAFNYFPLVDVDKPYSNKINPYISYGFKNKDKILWVANNNNIRENISKIVGPDNMLSPLTKTKARELSDFIIKIYKEKDRLKELEQILKENKLLNASLLQGQADAHAGGYKVGFKMMEQLIQAKTITDKFLGK